MTGFVAHRPACGTLLLAAAVDVVVDTASDTPFRIEPNVTPGWMWW